MKNEIVDMMSTNTIDKEGIIKLIFKISISKYKFHKSIT